MSYTYDAFGNSKASGTIKTGNGTLLSNANPFRYASYVFDEETYFYYVNARYYRPDIGRFITRDLFPDTSTYWYGNNNPVKFVDSTGYYLETGVDAVSWGFSANDFVSDPSWKNFGFLAWDTVAFFTPAPGSWAGKGVMKLDLQFFAKNGGKIDYSVFQNLDRKYNKRLKEENMRIFLQA